MATAAKKPTAKPAAAAGKKPVAKVAAPAKKTAVKAAAPAAKKPAPKPAVKKPVAKASAPVAKKPAPKPAAKKPAAKAAAPVAKKPAPKPAAKAAPTAKSPAPVKKPAAKAPAPAAKKPATKVTMPVTEKPAPKPTANKPAPAKKTVAKPVKKSTAGLITEAELLKMSDRDYMNEAQLEFFKNRLQTMKAEILENARETGEHLKENEVFADPNDRATVEEENMLEQRVRDRERKLLKKIDSALRRLEAGEYGYCLETGEPIGVGRLLARPTAELSIEAQEKHERMERLFAD